MPPSGPTSRQIGQALDAPTSTVRHRRSQACWQFAAALDLNEPACPTLARHHLDRLLDACTHARRLPDADTMDPPGHRPGRPGAGGDLAVSVQQQDQHRHHLCPSVPALPSRTSSTCAHAATGHLRAPMKGRGYCAASLPGHAPSAKLSGAGLEPGHAGVILTSLKGDANQEDAMSVFSDAEIDYLGSQRLGRLATVGPDGMPHVVPVAFRYNPQADSIDIGGHDVARHKKFRDVQRRGVAALVVDDVLPPWQPRAVEVRGQAVTLDSGGKAIMEGFDDPIIQIRPTRIVCWGLAGGFQARSVG
jgi:pyridoxamine 5'-phosphate oxidase family protein